MTSLRARVPRLLVTLFLALALLGQSALFVAAEANVGDPTVVGPQLSPVFDPSGPEAAPGAWLWSGYDGRWGWIPASSYGGGLLQSTIIMPERPQNAAVFWAAPTEQPGVYWVWNVYHFTDGDDGPSLWMPRWELLDGMSLLG